MQLAMKPAPWIVTWYWETPWVSAADATFWNAGSVCTQESSMLFYKSVIWVALEGEIMVCRQWDEVLKCLSVDTSKLVNEMHKLHNWTSPPVKTEYAWESLLILSENSQLFIWKMRLDMETQIKIVTFLFPKLPGSSLLCIQNMEYKRPIEHRSPKCFI